MSKFGTQKYLNGIYTNIRTAATCVKFEMYGKKVVKAISLGMLRGDK